MALIEICKADGSVETIEVPADQSPFETADTSDTAPQDHEQKPDCLFCFATGTSKAAKTPAPALIAAIPAHYFSNAGGLIIPQGLQAKAFLSTGPPSLTV